MERCKSGLIGSPGKTVYGNVPRVRIPPSPPTTSFKGCFFIGLVEKGDWSYYNR